MTHYSSLLPSLCPGDLVLLSRAHSCTQRPELVLDRRSVPAVFIGVSDYHGSSGWRTWLTFLCELGIVQTTGYWVEDVLWKSSSENPSPGAP